MIELYNTTSQPVNVGGWYLSDSSTNLAMYQIAANTTIAAGAYLVLTDAKNYGPGSGDPGAFYPFHPQQVWIQRLPLVRRARHARRGNQQHCLQRNHRHGHDGLARRLAAAATRCRSPGASPAQYDGLFTITVTGPTTFTYSMSTSPGTPPRAR